MDRTSLLDWRTVGYFATGGIGANARRRAPS